VVRVDVAFTPAALPPAALAGATALVIDVLRASTTMVTAVAHGCLAMLPVAEVDEARRRARSLPGALLAGERGGDPPEGFDLGNSPLEFTRALLAARPATAVGVAGFVNLTAAADWALGQGRRLVIVCAGELGSRSVEDETCAGLLVDRVLTTDPEAVVGPAALEAADAARPYAKDLARLAQDAPHARKLASHGRSPDVTACLTRDAFCLVPLYRADVDKVVPPYR
jgi:2-phosphosulfolactate phosphatase